MFNIDALTGSNMPNIIMSQPENSPKTGGFDQVLNVIQGMNNTQVGANQLMSDVILGKSEDSHGALIALEKASVQMDLAVKVRDELIQGYNKLINIQI